MTRRVARGFTLVEIAVVLLVLALLLGILATFSGGLVAQQRREITRQRLQGVDTALALFVAQNKRLPCPANGQLASSNGSAGVENLSSSTCANDQAHGVVPWRALGLAEQDVTDGWGNRFTYRVATAFVQTGSMNFTRCDPAGASTATLLSAPDATNGYCTSVGSSTTSFTASEWINPSRVTAGKGLRVINLANTTIMDPGLPTTTTPTTGAAYVVISHGENAAGAYNNQGVLQTAGSIAAGTREQQNFADRAYLTGCAATTCTAALVDDFPSFTQGTGYFDDIVLRPSILAVALKAQTGPRAH